MCWETFCSSCWDTCCNCWETFCCSCWETFRCSCCTDEETAPPPPPPPPPLLPPPSRPPPSLETNGESKPPGAKPEKPPITAAPAAGGDSSSQESDKVDPAIKEGNKKSEEGKKGQKVSTKHQIDNTATDSPTKEKERVKDVSSEKRGHDKSADGTSLQEGKPTYEHAHAAAAASSKPSSVQKNETAGPQANPRRTDQEERRVSTIEPTREAAAEHSQFSSVDGIGSQANPGRINQDQGRRK